ncbi:MAG TPA: hypothetical protein VEF06_05400 [Bryobacteraceae bacterium]|nr:hypothetical protein [Bryobacteraceae bacterium]
MDQHAARRDQKIFLLAAAAILIFQLMIPPVVGWADNGDFPKVLGRFDLYPVVNEGVYEFAATRYSFQPARHWESGFEATEIGLTWLAVQLNALVSKDGTFDLRVIGFVHGLLYFAAFWLFAPLLAEAKRWVRVLIYALAVFVFCDVMYVCGLNSFYMDEPALVFGLLTVVFYLRVIRWHRAMDAIGLMICPLLLVAAKAQYTVPGFFIAALFIAGDKWLWPGGRWRFTAAGVILAVLAGYMYLEGSPPDYAGYSAFNVVFMRILPESKDAAKTLADLGLDGSYRAKSGMTAYTPGSGMAEEASRQAFNARVSIRKIAVFFAAHPKDMWRALKKSLAEAGAQKSMGMFDRSVGQAPWAQSHAFALWSDFKQWLFFGRGRRLFFSFLAASAILAALLRWRRAFLPRGAFAGGLALIGFSMAELAIASLADAMDIPRHHLVFFALFDVMLLAIAGVAAQAILDIAIERQSLRGR